MTEKEKKKVPPRLTPDRDSKYMGLALVHAGFSKDPNTQIGAQIVSSNNDPLGSGYNGPPRRIDDTSFSWERPDKQPYIRHAEKNAIRHSWGMDLSNATIYVTGFPCPGCMLDIVDSGIARVVYLDNKLATKGSMLLDPILIEQTKDIAAKGQVRLELFTGNINWLPDWIRKMEEGGMFLSS